jgi:hypothetical protein
LKETILHLDRRFNRNPSATEEKKDGAFQSESLTIEWIQLDGNFNRIAKANFTRKGETLNERFQAITEAACYVAIHAWNDHYGWKTSIGRIKTLNCFSELKNQNEVFIRFDLLSATSTDYRADLTLLDRNGRVLARWEEVCGNRMQRREEDEKTENRHSRIVLQGTRRK